MKTSPTVRGARAKAKELVLAEIVETARQEVIQTSPADLSVRAVARQMSMASSAIYRYVKSRDELLTLLIIDAYNSLGQHVEACDAAVPSDQARARWLAAARGAREWALANPQLWSLIYGSPVPGYAAPADTVEPATRLPRLLVDILPVAPDPDGRRLADDVDAALEPLITVATHWAGGEGVSHRRLALGVLAWTHLLGTISVELFGHRHGVVADTGDDRTAYFDFEMSELADLLGLP